VSLDVRDRAFVGEPRKLNGEGGEIRREVYGRRDTTGDELRTFSEDEQPGAQRVVTVARSQLGEAQSLEHGICQAMENTLVISREEPARS
jgi:hypothetical protein